jgi:hypothetical protein
LQEALGDTALRNLGRGLAVGMPTHAIARDQQRGLFRQGDGNTILIAIACTLQAQFGIFDPQASSDAFR